MKKNLAKYYFLTLILSILLSMPQVKELHAAESVADANILKDEQGTSNLEISLTPEEQSWLKKHNTFRIAGPKAFPPFHYFDEEGAMKGMASEYITFILGQLNVQMSIQKNLPWPEVLKKAQNKEIDIISCAARSAEREEYLTFSEPYLSFPFVIISRKGGQFITGLDDLHGERVAMIKKVMTYEWLRRDKISTVPHLVGSPLEALKAVSLGDAEFYIGNLAAVSYLIEKEGLANLKIAAPTTYGNYNLYIAIRKDWPILVSILNKALKAITPEQHSAIRSKWISVRYEHGVRKIDILKWALGIIAIALVILMIIFAWNRRLQKEILERQRVEKEKEGLIQELQEALSEVKTLQGFLPICSHCKKIRDDKGYWNQIESYIRDHSDAEFSHGICPDCMKEHYSKIDEEYGLELEMEKK